MKENLKNYWYIIPIVVVILVVLVLNFDNSNNEYEILEKEILKDENKIVVEEKQEVIDSITSYFIDIKGEVKKPGVYEIESDKRVIDVINLAGGLTKNADTSLLNLSKKVKDEMSIKIYSKTEVKNAKESLKTEPEVIEIIGPVIHVDQS